MHAHPIDPRCRHSRRAGDSRRPSRSRIGRPVGAAVERGRRQRPGPGLGRRSAPFPWPPRTFRTPRALAPGLHHQMAPPSARPFVPAGSQLALIAWDRRLRGLHRRAASPICPAGVGRTQPSPTRSDPEGSSRNDFVAGRSGSHLPGRRPPGRRQGQPAAACVSAILRITCSKVSTAARPRSDSARR